MSGSLIYESIASYLIEDPNDNLHLRRTRITVSQERTQRTILATILTYQSSLSSSLPRCIALCLALSASARPPARLGVGVLRPLSVPLLFMLIPESRGAGAGAGLRAPGVGLFAGGAGGVGLARTADPFVPFGRGAVGGGGGIARTTGATGGGGGASSLR